MSAFGIVLLLMALLGLWEIVTGLLMMLMGLAIILCAYWRWTVAVAVMLALGAGVAWLASARGDAPAQTVFSAGPPQARSRT